MHLPLTTERMIDMKKLFALLLALLMLFSLAACGQTQQTTEEAPGETGEEEPFEEVEGLSPLAGGWTVADSPVVTDEVKTIMETISAQYEGISYVPVAYISSQVVAGTNHSILCKTLVDGEESGTYSIAVVYEDLEGNVELMNLMESDAEAFVQPLDGGWQDPESPEMTPEALDAFEKAMEGITDSTYTPLALVSTQVVAGTNYCVLAMTKDAEADGEEGMSLVYIYADLEGNAEVTEFAPFALNKG